MRRLIDCCKIQFETNLKRDKTRIKQPFYKQKLHLVATEVQTLREGGESHA